MWLQCGTSIVFSQVDVILVARMAKLFVLCLFIYQGMMITNYDIWTAWLGSACWPLVIDANIYIFKWNHAFGTRCWMTLAEANLALKLPCSSPRPGRIAKQLDGSRLHVISYNSKFWVSPDWSQTAWLPFMKLSLIWKISWSWRKSLISCERSWISVSTRSSECDAISHSTTSIPMSLGVPRKRWWLMVGS